MEGNNNKKLYGGRLTEKSQIDSDGTVLTEDYINSLPEIDHYLIDRIKQFKSNMESVYDTIKIISDQCRKELFFISINDSEHKKKHKPRNKKEIYKKNINKELSLKHP